MMKKDLKLLFSLPILSWALYDFSNTIFSANIVTLFFPQYITETIGQDAQSEQIASTLIAYASSIAAILLIVLSPSYGVYIDRTKKRKQWILLGTLIIFVGLCLMGVIADQSSDRLLFGIPMMTLFVIVIFTVIKFVYNSSLVFYDAMMTDIAHKSKHSIVSGFGVALGYMGTLFGVFFIMFFIGTDEAHKTFIPTAILFLLFSIPLFLFTKEPKTENTSQDNKWLGYAEIIKTFKLAKNYPAIYIFLAVYFFLNDALATAISMMQPYATTVIGFTTDEFIGVFLIATVFSVIGAFSFGLIAQKITSIYALVIVMFILMIALIIASIPLPKEVFYLCAILFGIAMGSIWVISRTLIIELAPGEHVGQFFGLFSMSGKLSAVVGPFLYGTITWVFSEQGAVASRYAILSLLVMSIIAMILHFVLIRTTQRLR